MFKNLESTTHLVALATIAACEESLPPVTGPIFTIPLGALTDITGGTGSTTQYRAAADLAARQMNEGLEMAGSPIRFALKVLDSRGDPTTSQVNAKMLINDHRAVGLVADISGVTLAVNSLNYDLSKATNRKVPVACYACSSKFFNDLGYQHADPIDQAAHRDAENWLFRVFVNGKYEAQVQARIALGKGASKNGDINGDRRFKVGIYAQNDPSGKAATAAMMEAIAGLAPTIPWTVEVVEVSPNVDVNTYDWTSDLQRLLDDKNANDVVDGVSDFIYLALLPNPSMAAVRAHKEADFSTPLMSTTAFRRTYILRNLGAAANGVEGNSPPLYVPDQSGQLFADSMMAANSEPPEQLCSGTYDAASTLMLSALIASVPLVRPNEVTPDAVRNAMLELFDPAGEIIRPTPADFAKAYLAIKMGKAINYKGASGVKFDPVGDNFPRMVHWQVEGGMFKELEAYDCSPETPMCIRVN